MIDGAGIGKASGEQCQGLDLALRRIGGLECLPAFGNDVRHRVELSGDGTILAGDASAVRAEPVEAGIEVVAPFDGRTVAEKYAG